MPEAVEERIVLPYETKEIYSSDLSQGERQVLVSGNILSKDLLKDGLSEEPLIDKGVNSEGDRYLPMLSYFSKAYILALFSIVFGILFFIGKFRKNN